MLVISSDTYHRILLDWAKHDKRVNNPMVSWRIFDSLNQELSIYFDQKYNIHMFLYFENYLVLFGNQRYETFFRIRYAEYF